MRDSRNFMAVNDAMLCILINRKQIYVLQLVFRAVANKKVQDAHLRVVNHCL